MTIHHLPGAVEDNLPLLLESILFVAEEAVDISTLAQAVQRGRREVNKALSELEERYSGGGIRLQRTGDSLQLVSAPEAGPYVERFLGLESRQRMSGAALEALAIIAYKQPTTRAGVEAVRGVNSDAAIASLIARGLIEEVGRAPGPGRPSLFGTTMRFLEHFGLMSPAELPPIPGTSPGAQAKLAAVASQLMLEAEAEADDAGSDHEEQDGPEQVADELDVDVEEEEDAPLL